MHRAHLPSSLLLAALLSAPAAPRAQVPDLVLTAKVRDFVDRSVVAPAANPHPHFYGDAAHAPDCDAKARGIPSAEPSLYLNDQAGDASRFAGDNRGPRLVSPLPATLAGCFEAEALFGQWYNDVPGVNRAFLVDLRLVWNASARLYQLLDDAYFPLDSGKTFTALGDPPFGHQVKAFPAHNFGFTTEIHATFTYRGNAGQFLSVDAEDDLWIFVDGKLVVDLGGVHETQSATVNLDAVAGSLGLEDGMAYALDIFHAERHVPSSRLRLSTSLWDPASPPVAAMPVAHPPSRSFAGAPLAVSLSAATPGAAILYSVDGLDPDTVPNARTRVYSAPLSIQATTVVKARAKRDGFVPSAVLSETYVLIPSVVGLRNAEGLRVEGDRLVGHLLEANPPESVACFDALGGFAGWAAPMLRPGTWRLPRGRGPLYLEMRWSDGARLRLAALRALPAHGSW